MSRRPRHNTATQSQFAKLKPGARIVTHTFEIPGLSPESVESFRSPDTGDWYKIFLYQEFRAGDLRAKK